MLRAVNQLKYIFFVALVAAFCANAGARPFGPDYGSSEACAEVANRREAPPHTPPAWLAELFEHPINPETSLEDECLIAFLRFEKTPAAFHQPVSPKD